MAEYLDGIFRKHANNYQSPVPYTPTYRSDICCTPLFSCTPLLTAALGEAVIKEQPSACAWATKHNKNSFSLINFYGQQRGHADTYLVQYHWLFLAFHICACNVCVCFFVWLYWHSTAANNNASEDKNKSC